MEFISAFEVPAIAIPVIDRIVHPAEADFIEQLKARTFSVEDARRALDVSTGESWPTARALAFLDRAYARGILRLVDEGRTCFEVATFYTRLEIFAVTETDAFGALPDEVRVALDRWFLGAYVESLGDEQTPTGDRVVTVDGALAFIDTVDRPIWLNRCDCRTLAGECDQPTDTCISFRSGINTLSDRGWSRPLSKDEAKDVVRRSSEAGLMQTVNNDGICNCCSDCCYLFRAQVARGSGLEWPLVTAVALIDADACIECGICVSRCPFGALTLESDGIACTADRCRGCGVCAQTCPTAAITMALRQAAEGHAR